MVGVIYPTSAAFTPATFVAAVAAASSDGSTVTTGTVTMTGANFIVLGVVGSGTSVPVVSDSRSNTYAAVCSTSINTGAGFTLQAYQFKTTSPTPSVGAGMTFSANSGIAFQSIGAFGFTLNSLTGATDQIGSTVAAAAGTTFVSVSTASATASPDIVIAVWNAGNSGSPPVVSSPYSTNAVAFAVAGAQHWAMAMGYTIQSAVGTATATATFNWATYGALGLIAGYK